MSNYKYTNDIEFITSAANAKLKELSALLGKKMEGSNRSDFIRQMKNAEGPSGDIFFAEQAKKVIDDYLCKSHLLHREGFDIGFDFVCNTDDFGLESYENDLIDGYCMGFGIKHHRDTLKFYQYGSFMDKDYKETVFGISTRTKKVKGHIYALFAWAGHVKSMLNSRRITDIYCDDIFEEI